jgi:acyl-CoA synthetase (AMP-forming)/AMP-acid ligase II
MSPGLAAHGSWRTLPDLLDARAGRAPDAPVFLAPGRAPLTYRGLQRHVMLTLQRLNALGIGRNDRVALVMPNGPEMAVAFLAVASGATAAPVNPSYPGVELGAFFDELGPRALVVQSGHGSAAIEAARARDIAVVTLSPLAEAEAGIFTLEGEERDAAGQTGVAGPEDAALVLPTSGTTSRSKLVPLTQANLCAAAGYTAASLELSHADRCLNVMPQFHVQGLIGGTLSPLARGGSVFCAPGFQMDRFFDWLEEARATWYTAAPTIHHAVVAQAPSRQDVVRRCPLRFIRSGAAALPRALMIGLEETFEAPVIEFYGLTEATPITSNPLPPGVRKLGSVGVAAGPEVAILDGAGNGVPAGSVGEIAVRGPNVVGAWPVEDRGAANGWFRTGDLGRLDEEGYLFLAGRLKELINRGGEKISPREIEDVLLAHAAVRQAVAFPLPHPTLGEDVGAAVVPVDGASVQEGDIRAFVSERLAPFKVPSRVLIVDEVPAGPTGKVRRLLLAEQLGLTAASAGEVRTDATPPRTPLEEVLASIWREVLGLEAIGVHEDFVSLGGDSIRAALIAARVLERLNVELSAAVLLASPTVARMAVQITEQMLGSDRDERAQLVTEIEALSDEEAARLLAELEKGGHEA